MPDSPFTPQAFYDSLRVFDLGIDSGSSPLNLPKNQLAMGTNLTVRGDYILPRSAVRRINLGGTFDRTVLGAPNIFQGLTYYKPDHGDENIVVALNGRLFVITPDQVNLSQSTVEEIPITGGPNPAT